MNRRTAGLVSGLMAAAILTAPATAQLGERIRTRMALRHQTGGLAPRDIAYGSDALQHLDFWHATGEPKAAARIVFVHGGGWKRGDKGSATRSAKVSHFLAEGYAVASINYRLVPAATVEEQAKDVAHAIGWLTAHDRDLGIDARRVIVMGHSAGAHLAALIGTDMHYLRDAGVPRDAIRGVVLLDGAAYDVPRQIADGNGFMHDTYLQALGNDPVRQRALSPTFQVALPNAPSFLILHIDRADGASQSQALAAALTQAGTSAEIHDVGGTGLRGHMQINRELGEADYPATGMVDAWLPGEF